MRQCIFCDNILSLETKPEHILMNALGGRKTLKNTTCSEHNEIYGGTIDSALAKQVEVIRHLLQLESGSGKSPPMLRAVKSGKDKLNLNSDGTIKLIMKPFTINKNDDGTFDIQINCRTIEELKAIIPNIAKATKRTEEDVRSAIKKGNLQSIQKRPEPIHIR
ncbi:MAG TPA: HNH endonuclease [Gammaproteobacteria bacterium]|jgi:hypothetical protein|nr:HNH endonuclease [Gammaproteobacteria bacterium]